VTLASDLERSRRTRVAIENLIANPELLGPILQPITRLSDGALVGHKATGRGSGDTEVADTLSLLDGAKSLGLVERLDWAFRCHTFTVALRTSGLGELHLTPEPETFGAACPPRLSAVWARGLRELDVVAELHEDAFADLAVLRRACDEMRGWGWRFAVADLADTADTADCAGVAPTLAWIKLAYVEVDLGQPGRIGQPAVRRWMAAGRAVGAQVLAVNVEPSAVANAKAAGADLARATTT
jgi:EAL domain-containing protein (putative c-di-GMP-specific phosphodiesterase class I)